MADTPILIIDDELSVIESLREFLEDEGYEVHQALDPEKGIATFRSIRPKVVIADLKMPGMSGIDMIKEIRKIDREVPIIIITGYGTLNMAIDAIRLDVFDFITKPIDLERLKDALDHAREVVQTAREIQQGMATLREEIALLQMEWKDQLVKLSEAEPLIQTGRLMSAILHNLSNPLSYIMGQAELLQALHPEMENLSVIREQAVRMKQIISTISRRIKKSQAREYEWLQLNDLLEEEVFFLESHPQFRMDIEKAWDLAPDLPPFKGIAAEFSQVFGNIIRNATEAMSEKEEKKLTIKTWYDSSEIHICIKDNGPGITAVLREKIFEPFFSTKSLDTRKTGSLGIGIGLYYCKEVVHHYGGTIDVNSRPGEGTAFIIHLPRRYDH